MGNLENLNELIHSITYERRLQIRNDSALMSYRGIGTLNKFNATNGLWNEKYFNSSRNIGCLSVIIKNAAYYYNSTGYNSSVYDLTLQQFYTYYFEISPILRLDSPEEHCGRSSKEIALLIQDFLVAGLTGDKYGNKFNLTNEEAVAYVLIRILDQTYEGFKNELRIAFNIQKLLPNGINVRPSSGLDDIDSGVDLYVLSSNNELLTAIQVKPASFFTGIGKHYIQKAIKEHDKKHSEFRIKWGINVYYVTEENNLLYSVLSQPNINLKENLRQDLNGILYEVTSRVGI